MSNEQLAIWIKENTFLGGNSTFTELDLEKLLNKDDDMREYFTEIYLKGVKNGLRERVSTISE